MTGDQSGRIGRRDGPASGALAGRSACGAPNAALRLLLTAVFLLAGCGGPPTTQEEQIRALIGAVAEAAEAGEVGIVADAVHPDYRDARGNDRRALLRLLRLRLATAGTVIVIPDVQRVAVHGPDAASVEMTVRFAEADLRALALDAGLRRVQLDLVRDDTWRVISARWSRGDAVPR
ncbi:MAG: hypothetical protein P8172_09875 [Gammaproteobacteria bacterium]